MRGACRCARIIAAELGRVPLPPHRHV